MNGSHSGEAVVGETHIEPDARRLLATPLATAPSPVPRVAFPPRWRTVLLATEPRHVFREGMSLYSANRRAPLLAQQALWAMSAVFGRRVVPGEASIWTRPMGDGLFGELWAAWSELAGRSIDGFAVYQRAQADRDGVAMLLSAGESSMFVRAHPEPSPFAFEQRVSEFAASAGISSFRVPAVLGSGSIGGWAWLAFEPLSLRPHAPARPRPYQLDEIGADATRIVEAVVPRPADVPEHWRGAHGDLTPWNLRRSGSTTWLIDWEDAGYAPPSADRVYFSVVQEALRRRPAALAFTPAEEEARRYWIDIVAARRPARAEVSLRTQMLVALGAPES